ncbi:MAG: branched-chain amino acid aminotransferase [Bdellovibrionota bacterium]
MMKIITELLPVDSLGFGQYFAPLRAHAHYSKNTWSTTEYSTDLNFQIGASAKVLHYAQEIFEGLKAYKQADGGVALFRPQANIHRMTESAKIMAMAAFPEDEYLNALKEVTLRLKHLVPDRPGALYLRPTTIGTSDSLGVAPSDEYEFFIIASPVGGYFKEVSSEKPVSVKIKVTDKYSRAAMGGTGKAKTGGNYAASLRAIQEAKSEGFANVLFLDAKERSYIEELGGMNFFVVDDGVLKTPPLGDTILAGVTRDSILRLAKALDIKSCEENLNIQETIDKIKSGTITEAFACGTAATISAIGQLGWKNETHTLGDGQAGPVSSELFKVLSGIYYGSTQAPEKDWILKL